MLQNSSSYVLQLVTRSPNGRYPWSIWYNSYPGLWLTGPISRSAPVRTSSHMQQYSHLITRRCRELNVYAELMPCTAKIKDLNFKPNGSWLYSSSQVIWLDWGFVKALFFRDRHILCTMMMRLMLILRSTHSEFLFWAYVTVCRCVVQRFKTS